MKIYKSEIQAGLESKLRTNNSVAYVTKINPKNFRSYIETQPKYASFMKAQAARDNMDLYPIDSILVSVGENKNDDVFDKLEVWEARHTPEDKPLNYNHISTDIVGHIVSNVAVDTDLQPIPEDIDPANLPDKFHIITASVIYKYLDNPDYLSRIETLIPEIEAGDWCVSMECLFQGFDYAMTKANGEQTVIPRNEETAYLTKHLRSYGGDGNYQDYHVGRLLRNITFSGHGLVQNPANPESVIFNNVKNFSGTLAKNVYFKSNSLHRKTESKNMDGIDIKSLDAYADLKTKCDRLELELEKYTSDASKAEVETLRKNVTAHETKINDLETQLANATKNIGELNAELTEAKKNSDNFKKMLDEEKDKRSKSERKFTLVSAGAPSDEIDSFLDQFGALADDQFAAVVALAAKSWKESGGQVNTEFESSSNLDGKTPNKTMEDTSKAKDKKVVEDDNEDDAEVSVLDNVEVTDSTTAAVNTDNLEQSRAEILSKIENVMSGYLGKRRK